jgi:two-component system, OmpR family, sensor histidine kinase KdpD
MAAASADDADVYSLRTLRKRGQLKVFLGYAPGVGKTFSMLAEAHRRASRGEDIVVGFVETHGRKETAELVEGLEQVPLKRLTYRGKEFDELDTAAVIARNPAWVLIDEMAHTNVPGTQHAKRWQSVAEIQAAGISVITTVNVQHFESLNDTVYEITGVRVQETLPDAVLDQADEVVLVDLTTSALLNRLRRGVVYDLDKIPGALANFFKRENLVALRELALRKTAEEVDEVLERMTSAEESPHPWATEERVIVCVRPSPVAAKLIRRGHRLAKRFQGRFWVLHVRTHAQIGGSGRRQVEQLFELARELGGEAVEIEGDSVGDEILRFARDHRATFIVLGQSRRSRIDEIVRGSRIARIMREIDHADVLVVADPSKSPPVPLED